MATKQTECPASGSVAETRSLAMRVLSHPATLLAGLSLVVYLPVLTTQTFFVRDLMLQYVPARKFLAESLASGYFPLWNPLLHGGQPFLANPQNLASYPPWLVTCVLPLLAGLNVVIVGHLVLGSISAYWAGRVLGLGRIASFVVGVAFSFSGVIVSLVNLTHMLLTVAWMPLLVVAFVRARATRETRWLAIAGLVGGMLILAGGAEMIILTFLTLGAFFVAGSGRIPGKRLRDVNVLVLVVLISMAIGAVRIWTTVEYLPETARGEAQAYSVMTEHSVHPRRLPELIAAGFMGETGGMGGTNYWGSALEGALPYLFSIHFGVGVLTLALFGALRADGPFPRPLRVVLGIVVLAGLLLALGRYLPGFEVWAKVPLISRFRYPVKALVVTAFPVALLAGAGLEVLAGMSNAARKRASGALAAAGMFLAGVALSTRAEWGRPMWAWWFDRTLDEGELARLAFALAVPVVAFMLLALTLTQVRVNSLLVAGLVCVEIVLAGFRVNEFAPRAIFEEPQIVGELRQATQDGRFVRVRGPEISRVSSPENSSYWFVRWIMENVEFHTAYLWGIPQVLHSDFDGMAPRRVIELRDMAATGDRDLLGRILDISGVRSILSNEPVSGQRFALAKAFRGRTGGTLFLYVSSSGERLRFVTSPLFVETAPEAVSALRSSEFDPNEQAVIEGPSGPLEPCRAENPSIHSEGRGPNRSTVRVSSPCAGYLIIADTFLPGWKTTVDGLPVVSERANVAFTAVRLEAGAHEVIRSYRPRGLFFAMGVSVASLIAALLLAFRGRSSATLVDGDL